MVPENHENENQGKTPKEYLTARVTQGLTQRFRDAIPRGFGFGHAVEIALTTWLQLPEDQRFFFLTHLPDEVVAEYAAAKRLWDSLPQEYRQRFRAGEESPSLVQLIEHVVDRKIAHGQAEGRKLRSRPPRKHGTAGSRDRGSDNGGR